MTAENDSRDVQPAIVKVFGRTRWAAAHAVRDFLHRCDVPFERIESKTDEQARTIGVDSINDSRLPVCVYPDGARMQNPSIRQITEKLGWFRDPSRSEYDEAIYGAGPAGLSAAVYAASEGLATALVERNAIGGQAGSSPKIENYLGFPAGIGHHGENSFAHATQATRIKRLLEEKI